MHGCGPQNDDSWSKFRQRREEWRARHEARRAEWKERQARHRAQWADLTDPKLWGMDAASWGMAPDRTEEVEALKTQVADMQTVIDKLLDRVAVLEKLAVDGDETRLAAEIEKLRTRD
jgi:hypothetical protein